MACIPSYLVNEFLRRLKSGEMDPEKLVEMGSKARHEYFASFLGEANAKFVNASFESKLLLKNQQQGIINWAKQMSGIKPEVKRDMISRVEKMTEILQPEKVEGFLADLAAQRLGIGVTVEEAGKIADLANIVAEKRAMVTPGLPNGSPERLEYGTALALFKEYVGGLKAEAQKLTPAEFMQSPAEWIETVGGATKGIAASLDNSFFGRQGFRTLVEKPDIWMRDFLKSWGDIGKELMGVDAMLSIKADVFSRQNAMNGKYQAMGIDIGLISEEAFPSQLPEKIPFFGRLYKASESAYNGAALRIRADLADAWIREAEANGVNVTDKDANIGTVINSITGRGKVDLFSPKGNRVINCAIFSIKYVKSNLDTLLAPADYAWRTATGSMPTESKWARKKAAQNSLKTIGSIAGILAVAKMLDPESVEEDPRSTKFGKIMVGPRHDIAINVSIGLNSMVTLAARILPTKHNGKWGGWVKNSKGKYENWWDGKFGQANGSDLAFNFMKGKASPIAAMSLAYLEARNRQFEKPTLGGVVATSVTPIPVSSGVELAKSDAGDDPILYAILTALEFIGVSTNPPMKKKRR
ncbi:MAG: hypothetical protein WC481_08630 [Candidatus Omnitrophota bacterium]